MSIEMKRIGTVSAKNGFNIVLEPAYARGLTELGGFGHAVILWHAHQMPAWDGAYLTVDKSYRTAPGALGIFATRSPFRPNGIGMSVSGIISADAEAGILRLDWIDADDGTPVLDIKPYHPSSDRIRDPRLPAWCRHWPANLEESVDFAWEKEFVF